MSFLGPAVSMVRGNDIVPASDITGGTSVFVFRGSSKKPQAGAAAVRSYRPTAATASANRVRINAQAATKRRQRANAATARAAAIARQRARERNARLRQSNVLTARAETQLEKGEIESSVSNFREALKLNPKNAEATNGLSEALTVQGIEAAGAERNDVAQEHFNEAVKLDARNDVAFVKLGEIHDEDGRNTEAIENFEKALAIDPEISAVYFPLGMAHAEAGNDEEAEMYLAKADVIGVATSESRLTRAMIMARQGRDDDALSAISIAINIDPTHGATHHEKARLLEKMGRNDDAFAALRLGTESAAGYAPLWFDLGVAYYNRADYSKAEVAYLEALKLDPSNAKTHAHLASTYRQMERFADANAQYRAANEKGIDGDPDLYSEWGFCLGKTKEWDKAAARLGTAEQLSPTAVDHNNVGWASYNAARVDMENEKNDEATVKLQAAKSAFQKAVEMDSNLSAAFLNLGATNNSLGDFDAAAVALNHALSLENNWIYAVNQLGLTHRGSNNLTAAVNTFIRATTIDPNNTFGLYNLGELYHLTGKKRDARRIFDRLKTVDPTVANRLNDVLSGKIVIDEAKRKFRQKVPQVPRLPF